MKGRSCSIEDAPKLLREAREAAGLTQQQMADRLKTTQQAYAKLEADDANPGIRTLDRAFAALGHQLGVGWAEPPAPGAIGCKL